jgi:GT2 family glycosyltransferase
MRYLDDNQKVFGCGCTLLNADGSMGISYGRFPELWTVLSETLAGRFGTLRCIVPKEIDRIHAIDFPCGAFFLIRRELLDKVGLLDEHFFMYCEETDLAKRAWKSGYRVVHFGPTKVVHLRGQSSNQNKNQVFKDAVNLKNVSYQSWYYYLKKHRTRMEILLIKCLLAFYFTTMRLFFFLKKNDPARMQFIIEKKALQENWK